MKGYCVKCKKMIEMSDPKISEVKGSRGVRRMAKGNCPECKTNVCAILKNQ